MWTVCAQKDAEALVKLKASGASHGYGYNRHLSALNLSRASIWMFENDRSLLCPIELCDRSAGSALGGTPLEMARYPAYFAALETARAMSVDDVSSDARTAELVDVYLRP